MARRKKKQEKDHIEVPMSAMIDIVFLLLVYFILTFKVEPLEAHMAVNMPSPSTGPPPPVMLEVHVLPGGYTLNQDQMDLKMLEAQLLRHTQFDKTQTVTIKVSMRAKQKNLIYVLDRCEKLDLVNLNVLTLR